MDTPRSDVPIRSGDIITALEKLTEAVGILHALLQRQQGGLIMYEIREKRMRQVRDLLNQYLGKE